MAMVAGAVVAAVAADVADVRPNNEGTVSLVDCE